MFFQAELITRGTSSGAKSDPLRLTSIYSDYGLLNGRERIKYSSLIVFECTAPEAKFPEPISILLNTIKYHFHCVSRKSNQPSSLS